MYVLFDVVPQSCVAQYIYAFWCDGADWCCPLCMCLFVWCQQLVLPAMYVLDDAVPPPRVARYVCADWRGSTLCVAQLCMCWLTWRHPLRCALCM